MQLFHAQRKPAAADARLRTARKPAATASVRAAEIAAPVGVAPVSWRRAATLAATRGAVAAMLLGHATGAWAQNPDTPNFRFNGYGTLGVVHSNEDQADFTAGRFSPRGAGHSRALSPEVDSRLALQLTGDLTSRLSAVGQLIVEQDTQGSYRPAVEWANVRFDVTEAVSLRAGRMVQPTFMASEYRKVGYAMPWVRPPQEFYRHVPVTSIDGVQADYRFRLGGATNTLRGTYGRNDVSTKDLGRITSRDEMVVTNTLEAGATTLFAAYSTLRLGLEILDPIFDAFAQFGPEGEAIGRRHNGKRFHLVNAGVRYDPGGWFVTGEWVETQSRTVVGDNRAWYVTGGYRVGSVTPYLTVARSRVRSATSVDGLQLDGLPPPLAAAAAGLNVTLNDILRGATAVQTGVSLGARWDFAPMAALKLQFDRLDMGEGSPGVLLNEQPGFRRGGNASILSLAVDFVF